MKKLRKFLTPLAADSLATLNLPPIRIGLLTKLNVLTVGLIVLTVIAISAFYFTRQWYDEDEDLRLHGAAIAATLAAVVDPDGAVADTARLDRVLDALAANPRIAYATVENAGRKVLAERRFAPGLANATLPAPAGVAASTEAAVVGKKDVTPIGFDKLAGFAYLAPEYTGTNPPPLPDTNQIPAAVRAFDGRKVALKGFMLPLKVQEGKVTELILLRDQSMCCFGGVPKLNEFVTVKMTGGGTKAVMDQAVTLVGKLKVGEFTENGYLLGIYQMDGERVEGPGL